MSEKKFKVGDRVETSGLHDIFDDHVEGVVDYVTKDDSYVMIILKDGCSSTWLSTHVLCIVDIQKKYEEAVHELQEKLNECNMLSLKIYNMLRDNKSHRAIMSHGIVEDINADINMVVQKVSWISMGVD